MNQLLKRLTALEQSKRRRVAPAYVLLVPGEHGEMLDHEGRVWEGDPGAPMIDLDEPPVIAPLTS